MTTAAYDLCSWCDGEGVRDFLSGAPCPHCKGLGMIDLNEFAEDPIEDWGRR